MKEKIGLYLRLSRDDERAGESMSIENQRSYLLQYIKKRNWTAAEIYIDDGYTGTNFDRPGFQRLLSDIEAGKINTVITKDLSRLGRDQIGTAFYYQMYFPKHQVRYISVTEGFDTAEAGGTSALFPFLTAANDFYTADISRKVRTALTTRKKEGKFIGAAPPLGYQKDPAVQGHLVVEPEGAQTVREIFQMYLQLGSVIGVAKALTERGTPTPSRQKNAPVQQKRFAGTWNDTMVRRILSNPTYAGHLTQNRRTKTNYKLEQRVDLPPEQWITVRDTHEAIIDQATFDRVQEMLAVRSYSHGKRSGHLLTGLAFCADCGSPMTYVRGGERRVYMVCQGYRKGGRLRLCDSHCVREDAVIEAVRSQLEGLARQLDAETLERPREPEQEKRQLERQAESLERKLEQCRRVSGSLYRDKEAGILTGEEFRELFEDNRAQRAQLEVRLEELRGRMERETDRDAWLDSVRELLRFETLDRETVLALVERVEIGKDKEIGITFRFRQPT